MVYTFDKNISLKSGRPPHIPDNDVNARLPATSADPGLRAWDEASLAYIQLAKIQGRIYNDLYCASALQRPETDRQASIDELNSKLSEWKEDFSAIDTADACQRDHFEFAHGPSDTIVESLRTIIHRASSLGPRCFVVSANCLRAATDCLAAHVRYISRYSSYKAGILDGYVNGVLSWTSLTPFAIVFMQAIVDRSPHGVACLQRAMMATGSIASLSTTCKRLHEVCFAFTNFAAAIVSAEQTTHSARGVRHHHEAFRQQPTTEWMNTAHLTQSQDASFAASLLDCDQTGQQVDALPVTAPESGIQTSASNYNQSINVVPERFIQCIGSNRPVFDFNSSVADTLDFSYEHIYPLPPVANAGEAQWTLGTF